ncbi:hypothetical protein COBT_002667, partial [Conglomerata obtusa]
MSGQNKNKKLFSEFSDIYNIKYIYKEILHPSSVVLYNNYAKSLAIRNKKDTNSTKLDHQKNEYNLPSNKHDENLPTWKEIIQKVNDANENNLIEIFNNSVFIRCFLGGIEYYFPKLCKLKIEHFNKPNDYIVSEILRFCKIVQLQDKVTFYVLEEQKLMLERDHIVEIYDCSLIDSNNT